MLNVCYEILIKLLSSVNSVIYLMHRSTTHIDGYYLNVTTYSQLDQYGQIRFSSVIVSLHAPETKINKCQSIRAISIVYCVV